MAFTKALFYPTIDIKNENWLKTAILFWDEISTIVPVSIDDPYQEHATQYLRDEGILKPIRVNPEQDYIEELTTETLNYLNSTEGFQLLTQGKNKSMTIHRDKLPRDVSRIFDIYPEKLPAEIRYMLRHTMTENGSFRVDGSFAYFYMTLLANKICEHYFIAPLTDNSLTSNFSDLVRLDNQIAIIGHDRHDYDRSRHRERYIDLAQGLLINMAIESISISEPTTLDNVVKFKRKHQDELGLFRMNIENLTKDIPKDATLVQIRQKVEDVYVNQFKPGYNALQKSLKGAGIKWATDNLMKVSFFSTGATAIPTVLLGLSVPYALWAGAGVSIISSLVSYNIDKNTAFRNNPYSYLLAVNKGI
ncbi:hypothetical protein EZS27_021894 [termite gut metagenome]|uniref:Uncharacterized protein n=1 Tax=termite gut metagenome TaxID=433724 RepID=A0A5J4R9A8_9ZZZZ